MPAPPRGSRWQLWSFIVVVTLSLPAAAAGVLTLAHPVNGEVLTIGSPYTLSWSPGLSSDTATILALLRCPNSYVDTQYCASVTQWSGLAMGGSFLFQPSLALGLNDGSFYRFQLVATPSMSLSTSGTFTFAPVPVPVDTRFEWPRSPVPLAPFALSPPLMPPVLFMCVQSIAAWLGVGGICAGAQLAGGWWRICLILLVALPPPHRRR